MANYNGSLQAVDSHSHSVRYDMAQDSCAGDHLRSLIRSPTSNLINLVIITIMANYSESLQAVDSHRHSVRYDIALESSAGGHLRCLIRSPMTL
eukprot:scaffold6449_cov193-Skeletonema_marinoi.AAC.1